MQYRDGHFAPNRFTVTMGVLSDGRIVAGPKGGDGVQLGYNAAGERVLAVYASDGRTERYEYDANGCLTNQSINGVVVRERESDLLGRVTGYTAYTADRSKRTEQVTRQYDADGLQTSERDVLEGATTRYVRMSDGTLERTERRPDKGDGTTVTTAHTYEWWDGAKQKATVSQGTNPNAPGWKPASSYYNYDVNGNLKSVYDDGGGQGGKARAFSYWTDLRGQVQRRDELVGVSISSDGAITGAQGDRKHNYYYLNGHRVGNVGNDGVEKVDYVQELAGKLGKGKESQYRVTTPVSVADFDENYLRIDGTYPGTSPGTWTVREGETLKSIASALWGDETLWYVLADANGLKSTDELKAGQTLTVPNKVTNVHNTASTFKPYDPGQAIGDTQPTLPDPPPPPGRGGGCGGFLPVIAIVVAVVAVVMTYGATSPYMASLAGSAGLTGGAASTAAAVGAGAVAGATGALASQGVMIAGGAQSGLDWKGVALGAMGGAVAGGVTSAMPAGSFGTAAAQGAARSVATQGIGLATGLQDRFDWKSVAASAIASGVGYAANQAIGQLQYGDAWKGMTPSALRADTFNAAVRGFGVGMAAGAASTVVRGGSLGRNVGAITMDAIASTVGNMVVDQVQAASLDSTTRRTQDAIAAVNGQILPGGLGGVGSGFVAPESTYSNAALLYGAYGGLVDTTPTTYSSASVLYGVGGGAPAAPTVLAGQPFRAQFPDASPGIQVADASEFFAKLGKDATMRTDAMLAPYKLPPLDPLAGQPKLVPMDAAASRASSGATFRRFMETQGTQPIGGLMANAAIQATGNTGYAVAVADAAGPLDALWAPAGGRFNSVASVRRGQPALESVGPSATLSRIESRFGASTREVGFIVDSASGNILTVARQSYGQSSASFKFGPEQWALAEGNWITHNHPSGLTLGIEDLAGAVASGARGIRASTAIGTYELTFDRSFGAAYRSDYAGAYGFLHAQTNEIGRGIMADIRSGAMAVPQELQGAQRRGFLADEMWFRFSSQMPNLKYNFYPR
ncbi:LysM peptidoglycan-binding domain-containing protein [Burkholderia sp. S-53]|uniref:LysM peptidoglycan-binding domain-containing protein n=1 Tax=Burkholderia sp. S-53 TaxID=2906514 RepID=UPI0021CE111F|nr:LysM peptidoglycan-binding domain-containing protein [Burkholderia sp. S-53]UXU87591.1 LysM peptidoglycan-binding domain-containing protein [Burkholderia sp. S-53]